MGILIPLSPIGVTNFQGELNSHQLTFDPNRPGFKVTTYLKLNISRTKLL